MRMHSKARVLPAVFLAALWLPLTAWGAVSDLQYRAPLLPGAFPAAYSLLELPDEVVGQTQPGLPDVRLYRGEDEIPYALVTAQELTAPAQQERAELFNQGSDAQGNLRFEMRLPPQRWLRQINLLSPDRNFIRRVQVEGSWDQQEWLMLAADSTIFDLTQEQKARHLEVNLRPTNFPHLRVTVFGEGKGSFRLDGAALVYASQGVAAAALKERPHALELAYGKDGLQEYTLDLYQPRLPSQELQIVTAAENFNRLAEVYGSDDRQGWRLLATGELYSYRLDKLAARQLGLQFKAEARYLKLKIHNRDNQPLAIAELKVLGRNPALIFPAGGEPGGFLYWHSTQLKVPVYDLQKFKGNLDYAKLPRAALGPAEENQAFQFQDLRPWSERNAWLLQLSLVALVAVLLVVILRSIRSISGDKG